MAWTPILSYAGSYRLTFEEFFQLAAERGFREVQITPDQEPNLYSDITDERMERLAALRIVLGIDVHVHNVFYDINLASLVPDVQEVSFRITESVLAVAAGLQAKSVTVHPGYMFPGWRREAVQRDRFERALNQSLLRLSALADRYSIAILLENGAYHLTTAVGTAKTPLHLGISPDDFVRLMRGAGSRLGLCLDVNKAMRSGADPMEFVRKAGNHVRQLQVSTARKYVETVSGVINACQAWVDPVPVVLEDGPDEALDAIDAIPGAVARSPHQSEQHADHSHGRTRE